MAHTRRPLAGLPGGTDFAAAIRGTTSVVFTSFHGPDAQKTVSWRLDLNDAAAKPPPLFEGCTATLDVSPDGNYVLGPVLLGANPGTYQYSLTEKKCTALKPGLASYFALYGRDGKSFLFESTGH